MQGARLLIGIPVDQSAIHSIVGARLGGSAFSVGARSRRLSRRDGQRLLQTEALNQPGKEEGKTGKKVGRGKSRATKKPLGLKNPAACACLARSSSRSHGVPMGIRTPVLTVRGSCPRPLDDRDERLCFAEISIIYVLKRKLQVFCADREKRSKKGGRSFCKPSAAGPRASLFIEPWQVRRLPCCESFRAPCRT